MDCCWRDVGFLLQIILPLGLFAFSVQSFLLLDPQDDEEYQVPLVRVRSFAHRGAPLLRQVRTPLEPAYSREQPLAKWL